MTLRNFSSSAAEAILAAGISAANTTIQVSGTTGFPAAPFTLAIDAGTSAQELVLVTGVAGTTLTVTRGYDSTVATTHEVGAKVQHSHGAIDFREANSHVNAITDVHGMTAAAFTPVLTGSGTAPVLGNGLLTGRSVSVGKLITAHYNFVAGSTTTFGSSSFRLSLPVPSFAHPTNTALGGWFYIEDAGTAGYMALPRFVTTTTLELVIHSAATNGLLAGVVGATTPFTFGNGDIIRGYVTYEAA